MAALDKILESMTARKADLFSLKSGEVPLFHTGSGTPAVGSSPLTEERVLAYLRELAGPAERAALEAREAVTLRLPRLHASRSRFPPAASRPRSCPARRPARPARPTPAAADAARPPPRRAPRAAARPAPRPRWRSTAPSTRAPRGAPDRSTSSSAR